MKKRYQTKEPTTLSQKSSKIKNKTRCILKFKKIKIESFYCEGETPH